MREHQIVITLKPEQFAQIQQMSKAAGAKTMGSFVRKALLAALEIEGVKQHLGTDKSQTPEPAENPSLLVDLHRMHGELKELIAQSLLSTQEESFDPFANLMVELGMSDDQPHSEEEPEDEPAEELSEDPEENPLSKEEPIVSSIKVSDPLDELLDERLKTRLATYLEHQRKGKPKVPTTRREPPSQSISDLDETPKKDEENTPKPKPSAPRSIPPDQLPRKDETGFSGKSIPLSGNPPPKKPKY